MLTSGRLCLALTLLLQLLTLGSCLTPELNCLCQQQRDRSELVDLACSSTDNDMLFCDRDVVPNIPLGYKLAPGYGLYKVYATKRVQEEARRQCQLDGARLAVLQDATQTAAITELLADKSWLSVAYIGFTDEGNEGVWTDLDGNEPQYIPWIPGQPDNKENENCATLNTDALANDVECDQLQAFVCERPLNGQVPDDYLWAENAGRFYKYHSDELTYQEARSSCEAEGAQLAVPDTLLRAEEILSLLLPGDVTWMWIGVSDLAYDGVFATDSGRLLSSLEFQNWVTGQPNGGTEQDCVLLLTGGYIGDRQCDEPHTYLCEIAPPAV